MKLSVKQQETLRSLIGEGVHTGLRKWCESPQARTAWLAIRDLPAAVMLKTASVEIETPVRDGVPVS